MGYIHDDKIKELELQANKIMVIIKKKVLSKYFELVKSGKLWKIN